MQSLTFSCRGVERSGALEARIREIAERLVRCNGRITQCHVTVVGGSDETADSAAATIHVSVPGAQIHADSAHADGTGHRDVFQALGEAYDSARRQLRDLQRDSRSSSLLSAARDAKGR